METAMAIVDKNNNVDQIPEGMEVVGTRVLCSKHGDVSYALWRIPYSIVKPGETKATAYEHFFCTQCLAEYFDSLAKEGKLGELTLERQVADHETAEKIKAQQAEAAQKLKEQMGETEAADESAN